MGWSGGSGFGGYFGGGVRRLIKFFGVWLGEGVI